MGILRWIKDNFVRRLLGAIERKVRRWGDFDGYEYDAATGSVCGFLWDSGRARRAGLLARIAMRTGCGRGAGVLRLGFGLAEVPVAI